MGNIELRLEVVEKSVVIESLTDLALDLDSTLDLEQIGSEHEDMLTAVFALDLVQCGICVGKEAVAGVGIFGNWA